MPSCRSFVNDHFCFLNFLKKLVKMQQNLFFVKALKTTTFVSVHTHTVHTDSVHFHCAFFEIFMFYAVENLNHKSQTWDSNHKWNLNLKIWEIDIVIDNCDWDLTLENWENLNPTPVSKKNFTVAV
jgi:hypothetical protein